MQATTRTRTDSYTLSEGPYWHHVLGERAEQHFKDEIRNFSLLLSLSPAFSFFECKETESDFVLTTHC